MGLALGGLQKVVAAIADVLADLVGQDIVAKSITLSQASGSDAVAIQTNGARVHFGGGAADYASSDGTTVTFAGPLASAGLISSAVASGSNAMAVLAGARVNFATGDASAYLSRTSANTLSAAGNFASAGDLSVGTGGSGDLTVGRNWFVPFTDSSGTPGAATIDKVSGRSAIASGAASVVITNVWATVNSRIFISPLVRDATGLLPIVSTHGAGSFTVSTTAVCTANLSFDWVVIN